MKILLYTPYFWPESFGIAPMTTGLADYLSERGWEVKVVTAVPSMPAWEIFDAYKGKAVVREKRGGYEIIRSWVYVPERPKTGLMKAWRRVLSDSSMGLNLFPFALGTGRPDVIVTVTPPLQAAAAAVVLKRIWGCPVVSWLQDIVPDAAISVGMMQEGTAVRLGRKLESFVYRNVDTIAIIAEGFAGNLRAKGVPEQKLYRLPNWADLKQFNTPSRRDEFRARLGVKPDDFVLIRAGSLSAKQVLENAVRAMKLLEGHTDIHFFFLGDGIRKANLMQEIERLKVPRVSFLPTAGGADYVDTLRAADLLVLNQSKELVDALIPSKLLTYMPSERPVIAAVNSRSEAARFVERSGCGVVVEAEDPEKFAAAVLDMRKRPEELRKMGAAGNEHVREHFAKDELLETFEKYLRELARPRG